MLTSYQNYMKKLLIILAIFNISAASLSAQINTDRVMSIGRNALYFEDYVLSIQYFNQVIKAKPWLAEPYFYRAVAKLNLDDLQGAESDCSLCIERNPYIAMSYFCRGISRQGQEKYAEAITDYTMGLKYKPDDKQMLLNRAIAAIQSKDYQHATPYFEELFEYYPRNTMGYIARGSMSLEQGDTIKAINDYDKAVELDKYFAPAYSNRAILRYQRNDFDGALSDLNEAIHLEPQQLGNYINRGLVRYHKNDLRGAMADYDKVLERDKENIVARFNRGLLRYQVGDNNRAAEDFDVVIRQEPDNYLAYYNRALLRTEIGNYKGAISDFDVVLDKYPEFIPGFVSRSEVKRKMNDIVGADKDYWHAMNLEQEYKKKREEKKLLVESDSLSSGEGSASENKVREKSDVTINKFNRLVVYDKEDERKNKYKSDVRGRVQDKNVRIDLEPQFVLTYYEKVESIDRPINYIKIIDEYNSRQVLPRRLKMTNQEASLLEDQISIHFTTIDDISKEIGDHSTNKDLYFARGLEYMLVQNFEESIKDFDKAIELDPAFLMAYFNRAVVRYRQYQFNKAESVDQSESIASMNLNNIGRVNGNNKKVIDKAEQAKIIENIAKQNSFDHEMILRDINKVIELDPNFSFAYYNRANIKCSIQDFRSAVEDYNRAIEVNPMFAEAYYNRGLSRLYLGETQEGIADLSKAGELGIYSVYNIIKRMTE